MKKLIGIVFLCVLLLQVAGSYVYFIVRLSTIRQEMRQQLKNQSDENLTLLTLTPEVYQKAIVNDQEIEVNEKMYDIARIVIQNNKVLVYALHDDAEDNLLAFLHEMLKRSSKDKKPVPSHLIQLLTLQFVIIENNFSSLAGISAVNTTPYNTSFSSFISSIGIPPPRG